jgi:hypothetical protein
MATSTPATIEFHRKCKPSDSRPLKRGRLREGGSRRMLTQAASAAAGSPINSPAGFTPSSTSQRIRNAENRMLNAGNEFLSFQTLAFDGSGELSNQAVDFGAARPSIRSDIPLKRRFMPKKSPSTHAESEGHRE